MNLHEKRIAIAKACGWTNCEHLTNVYGLPPNCIGKFDRRPIPDYFYDLNAMHKAEGILNAQQLKDYYEELTKETTHPFRANAMERAESFVNVINLQD